MLLHSELKSTINSFCTMDNENERDNESLQLTAKQNELQQSVDGVNNKLNEVTSVLNNAIIQVSKDDDSAKPVMVLDLSPDEVLALKNEIIKLHETMKGLVAEVQKRNQEVKNKCETFTFELYQSPWFNCVS